MAKAKWKIVTAKARSFVVSADSKREAYEKARKKMEGTNDEVEWVIPLNAEAIVSNIQ
jgi:hypothetical protein